MRDSEILIIFIRILFLNFKWLRVKKEKTLHCQADISENEMHLAGYWRVMGSNPIIRGISNFRVFDNKFCLNFNYKNF